MAKFNNNHFHEITILDALTFGPDIDLSIFNQFGKTKVYSTTNQDEVIKRIIDSEVIISNKVKIGKKELAAAPQLKLICVAATGYNNIDIEAAKENGVVVANVKNYSTESVAQHTFSLILALQNSLVDYIGETRNGNWSKSPVFTMLNHPFYEMTGKKLGIIGYGTIGKRVAEIAKAFGMQVLIGKRPGVEYNEKKRVDFDYILTQSDIITIHTPLSDNTLNLFGEKEFKQMKTSAILINTARGGIVNEEDLYKALKNNTIRAAAIDVVENEPINSGSKLPELPNLLITPHMAWASLESRQRLIAGITDNINLSSILK